ncbi:MAG TPA: tetratricopeptide repeat protein [Bacteroidia bacterium]|nr:tetratricopeptide repeat protein [Bacteroidia bacterium]
MGTNLPPLADTSKANILNQLALNYWGNVHDTGMYYAQQVLTLSKQIGYGKGIGNAYNTMGLCAMAAKDYAAALENYKNALKVRSAIGDKNGLAWTYNNLGLMSGNMGEIEESIQWHRKSLEIKQEIGDKAGMAATYGKIGHDYVNLGKFPEAVYNYLNALKIGEENNDKLQICGFYNDIGNVYYSEGNYPEASKNYKAELKIAKETGDRLLVAFAEMNMGRICYNQGNDTAALNYTLASLKIFEKVHDIGNVADVHYNLGLVYLAMGKYSIALSNADSCLREYQLSGTQVAIPQAYIEIGSIYKKENKLKDALDSVTKGLTIARQIKARVLIKDAYKELADINAALLDYKAANEDNKEYIANLDSISSNESTKKIATLEMNYAFDKREDSIRAEQEKTNIIKTAESNRKTIITGSAIVISILTLLMAVLLVNRQQIKRRKDKIIFEKETNLLLLEKQKMEDELAKAGITLNDYIINMMEKNALLEQFKTDVENLKNLKAKEIDENRVEQLEHLNKTTILTDEDWNKFKELFERAYKGFFIRLKEKLPDLTQAEIRLLCLTKLKLETKEMGAILGVSFDTIKKSRHRLRKKLGLAEEDSLDDIANSI